MSNERWDGRKIKTNKHRIIIRKDKEEEHKRQEVEKRGRRAEEKIEMRGGDWNERRGSGEEEVLKTTIIAW